MFISWLLGSENYRYQGASHHISIIVYILVVRSCYNFCVYICTCVCVCLCVFLCACMHGHVCVLNCPLMWEVNRFNSHFVIRTARHLTKYVASGSVLVNFLIVKSLLCRTMFFISTHIYFCYCTSLTINHQLAI